MKEIVGILLAAGSSRRFEGNKLLHPLSSGALMGMTAARCLVTAIPASLAVIRAGDQDLAEAFEKLGLRVVENPDADSGMGRSLATGVLATQDAAGWVVALADMPWIQSRTIASIKNGLQQGGSMIAPVYHGRRGHPVGFERKWRSHLLGLTGDQGARSLLSEHSSELTLQPTTDPGILVDIDRRTDLCRV